MRMGRVRAGQASCAFGSVALGSAWPHFALPSPAAFPCDAAVGHCGVGERGGAAPVVRLLDDWAGWHAHTVVAVEGLGLGQVLGSYTPGIGLRPKRLDQGIGGGCDEGHAPWHESEAQLGKRLKAAAGHCTHKFDLESLCKAFPDEMHDLVHVTKGDRLNK